MTVSQLLANALCADLARRLELARELETVDEEIAKAAQATFENALGAAYWLTEPAVAFSGQVPLEVSRKKAGKEQVIYELRRIDYNLPP
jgi:uncharacterized protein (DUF2384 family)